MRAALIALMMLGATTATARAQIVEVWDYAPTDALGLVRDTCFAHRANADAITADLSARGWRQLSDGERRQRDPENFGGGFIMHWTSSQAWAPADDSVLMLVLGEGPLGQGDVRADFCMIVERAAFSQQVAVVRRWLGFQRFQAWGPGGDNFAHIREENGEISNGASAEDAVRNAAVREGRFGFIQVIGDRTTSVVNFSVIRASPEGEIQ